MKSDVALCCCCAQVSWDFHRAAKAGFAALGDDAKTTHHPPVARGFRPDITDQFASRVGHLQYLPGPSSLGGWEFWEGFLRDPLSPTAVELKMAMRTVTLAVSDQLGDPELQLMYMLDRLTLKCCGTQPRSRCMPSSSPI
jgi:hypothetical protein